MPYIMHKPTNDKARLWHLYHEYTTDLLEAPNRAHLGNFNPSTPKDLLAICAEHQLPLADTLLILWAVRTRRTSCDTSSEIAAQLALAGTLLVAVPFALAFTITVLARKSR